MRRCIALGLLAALACGGCPVGQSPSPNPNPNPNPQDPNAIPLSNTVPNLDGAWRYDASGSLPAACITINSNRISAFDQECDSVLETLLAQPGGSAGDTSVTLGCVADTTPNDALTYAIFSFYLTLQPDGTMTGQAIVSLEPAGTLTYANVVWQRQ